MAYANTASVEAFRSIQGHNAVVVTVAETGAGATSEWSAPIGWDLYTIVSYRVTLTSGSGSTVNPKLGRSSGWSADTQDDIGTNVSTSAHIADQTRIVVADAPTLYGVSQVDTGTDNAISTEIIVVEGVL